MNINVQAKQLLTYFSPEERTIPDHADYPDRNAAVMLAMNGALQEIFGKASPWVRYDETGQLLRAPTEVTITVTNGSTSGTITAGWESWMAGCSIVIEGSSLDNAIKNDSASATLKFPHDGTSGSKSGTVYHDCVTPAVDIMEVCEPVKANGRLLGVINSGDYPSATRSDSDFGFHRHVVELEATPRVSERIGQPLAYAVETWCKDAATGAKPRIKIQPAPDAAGFIEFRAMLAPPVVITSLTSTALLPIPLDYVQSIFMPFAAHRLMTCPFFLHGERDAAIVDAYGTAQALLDSLNPRKKSGTALRALY